ncbi:insulinase family protein [bacterium]|jgi:zinc protease|nr:insulinase family protein [bacterium]
MATTFKPEQYELSNGIPVVLQNYEGTAAATYWWNQVGSGDERPHEAGFAHFLEHMLFKDAAAKETGKASSGQLARAVESLGGDINAYTSFDQTVYHVTCAAQHWEKVISAFGDMAKPQRFLKSDFEREREVILEELRKNEDSPGRQLFQNLFSATFSKHPYGKPVIGFTKTLKAAKVAQLEEFYRNNYVANKMGLILVGPFDDTRKKQILQILEKKFGSKVIPSGKTAKKYATRPTEPEHRGQMKWTTKAFDVQTPSLSFSFRVPDLRHEDIPALDVIAGVLGMGEVSRLYQRLFYKTSLATEVSGGLYVPSDPGMLYFQIEAEDLEKLTQASREAFEELARISKEGPTAEEVSRIIVNTESERYYSLQTADGIAGRIGFLKFIMGDLNFDQTYLDQIRAVNPEKIQAVAKKYLDARRMSGAIMVPKANKDFDASEIIQSAKTILAPQTEEESPKTKKNAVKKPVGFSIPMPETFTTPSGIRVLHRENKQSHVASIYGIALGGLRLEIANPLNTADMDWGSSNMMSMTWTKGTHTKTAKEIASIVEGHAAGIDGFSGRNTIGLQMTLLARDWNKLSSLFTDVLVNPNFAEEEVAHTRRVVEDTIRGIEDHTSQLCSKLFLETLFETHPYGRMTYGSFESIKSINSSKLAQFHRRWMKPDELVISVAGAVSRPQLNQMLGEMDREFEKAAKKGASGNGFAAQVAEEPRPHAPRLVERNLGREQTHIIVGSIGTKMGAKDQHALHLLQNILGGQSGRLFIELREKKSLGYTVAPVSFEGIENGYVGTYIACSPSKKEEALKGIQTVLETLAKKGPTAAEMNRAKEYFVGRRAMELQSDSSLASHFGLRGVYNLPIQDEVTLHEKIKAISAKDLQDLCQKYLVEPAMVTSIVG